MHWESIGFKEDPFNTDPISERTLSLYTGNEEKLATCQFALKAKDVLMVIEGPRGVGTTSFANYLRFKAQQAKEYFTPTNEIRVEPHWSTEVLLAAIISNIVMELELYHLNDVQGSLPFKEAKAVVTRIAETYRSFGAQLFNVGVNYGKSGGVVTQPMLIPSPMLAHHLENLIKLVIGLGYKYGILIQLNNLDVGVVQKEDHLKSLLNVMRDYFQTSGMSWMLVGDNGIRKFIAQEVDRLDDIVKHEVEITPLSKEAFLKSIDRRIKYYKINDAIKLPMEEAVLLYLYDVTKGRLRYIFGLITRLFNVLQVGTLVNKVTLDVAKPIIKSFAMDRVKKFNLTPNEERVLMAVVEKELIQVKQLAILLDKKNNYLSAVLAQLQEYKLVSYRRESRHHFYYPSVDAYIAYGIDKEEKNHANL
jgi:hypothetical protein